MRSALVGVGVIIKGEKSGSEILDKGMSNMLILMGCAALYLLQSKDFKHEGRYLPSVRACTVLILVMVLITY